MCSTRKARCDPSNGKAASACARELGLKGIERLLPAKFAVYLLVLEVEKEDELSGAVQSLFRGKGEPQGC
jgi:hypothetical protein